MDYFFAKSKIFRLHYDAAGSFYEGAGSVSSTTYKGPGYCYVLPRFPSSCFLGHGTRLFFCLYVKIILHQYMPCSTVSYSN